MSAKRLAAGRYAVHVKASGLTHLVVADDGFDAICQVMECYA